MTQAQLANIAEKAGFEEVAQALYRPDGDVLFDQIMQAIGGGPVRIKFPTTLLYRLAKTAQKTGVRREVINQLSKVLSAGVQPVKDAQHRMPKETEELLQELFIELPHEMMAWLDEDRARIDALVVGVTQVILGMDGRPRTTLYTTAPQAADYVGSIERSQFVIPRGEFIDHWPEVAWRVVDVLDGEIDQQRYRWSRFDTSGEHTAYSLDYDPRDDIRKRRERSEEFAEQKRLTERDRRELAAVKTVKQLNDLLENESHMYRPFPRLERSEIRQRLAMLEVEEKTAKLAHIRYKADALVPRYVVERKYYGNDRSGSWHAEKFLPFSERDRRVVEIAHQWGTRFVAPASTVVKGSPSERWPSDAVWDAVAGKPGVRRISLWYVKGAPVWQYGTYSHRLWVNSAGNRIRTPKEADGPFVEIDGDKPDAYKIPGLPLKDE